MTLSPVFLQRFYFFSIALFFHQWGGRSETLRLLSVLISFHNLITMLYFILLNSQDRVHELLRHCHMCP